MCTIPSLVVLLAATSAQAGPRDALLGEWRGTSICTDRKIAPACNDETVVYVFTPAPSADKALLKADKIVDGARVTMYEIEFAYDEAAKRWTSEFRNARGMRGLWSYELIGTSLEGFLYMLPGREVVRRISVRKS